MDCCIALACSGSTPMMRQSGSVCRRYAAMPLISPPPPTGTSTTSADGQSSAISSPTVPCPAMMRALSKAGTIVSPCSAAIVARVVEGRNDREPLLGGDRLRACLTLHGRRSLEHDLRAQGSRAFHLHAWCGRGHHDDRPDAEQLCGERHALRVIAGRVRDHAARALLVRQ